jgi:hypothetical protein
MVGRRKKRESAGVENSFTLMVGERRTKSVFGS